MILRVGDFRVGVLVLGRLLRLVASGLDGLRVSKLRVLGNLEG